MTRRTDQARFDRFSELAARLLGVPIVYVSLAGPRHGVVMSSSGLAAPILTLLLHTFSRLVVASRRPLVIGDARDHAFLAGTPAVRDGPVVAYAGVPLFDARGRALGALCVMDSRPRAWTAEEVERLHDVAWVLIREVEWRAPRAHRPWGRATSGPAHASPR